MWSLGCVIAELFLGWPLYPGASEYDQVSNEVLFAKCNQFCAKSISFIKNSIEKSINRCRKQQKGSLTLMMKSLTILAKILVYTSKSTRYRIHGLVTFLCI